jgi:two-component system sensor histidine kinase/response regulator
MKRTALIIHSDKAAGTWLRGLLEQRGLNVIQTEDGGSGVGQVKLSRPDLVVMDYEVPGLDGLTILEKLRRSSVASPVILIVPRRDAAVYDALKKFGPLAVLVRPPDPNQFLDAIVRFFPERSEPPAPEPREGESSPELSSLPILLVEDQALTRELMISQLKSLGYPAQSATHGREALRMMEQASFSLILMDYIMPEMGGVETTKTIRRLEGVSGRHIPIIGLTARMFDEDRGHLIAMGFDDQLRKPAPIAELARTVKYWLANPGAKVPPPRRESNAAPTTNTAFDPTVLAGLPDIKGEGGQDLVVFVIDTFLAGMPDKLKQISRAVDARDPGALEIAAHTLASLAAQVGANAALATCRYLETLGKAGSCHGAAPRFDQLTTELAQARVEMEKIKVARLAREALAAHKRFIK